MVQTPEINSYFQGINRGSLVYHTTTNFISCNYLVIGKLREDYFFLRSVNQKKLPMHITQHVLTDNVLLFNVDTCDEGHSIKKCVWSSTNAF